MFIRLKRKFIAAVFFLACSVTFLTSFAPYSSPDSKYKLLKGPSYVVSKNYYLLTLFNELPEVNKILVNDEVLSTMAINKTQALANALKTCDRDGFCYTAAMKFSDEEINKVSDRLSQLYAEGNAFDKLVTQHLMPSGCYIMFKNASPKELLVKAWEQDAKGINFALSVYAEGNKPHYPNIDSISFNTRDSRNNNTFIYNYVSLLYNTASLVATETVSNKMFFVPSLNAAMYFLEMNEREQAADFEPMEKTENKAAYDKIKTIKWDKYKYSLILIPGAGPEEPNVALSAEGMLRCRLGVMQYQKGLAPFIVVSGGKVHPFKTKYCEATEMKKYLMERLGVPEAAIIIEPHARHTTTNMRNTVRIMYRNGIPLDKPGLTCTTRFQSAMIENTLIARCLKELNESPFKVGKRLTETEVEFYPSTDALHIDPTEPMDP